jgi:uncharacterized protein YlzI (FlbEa/FlbD family)
VQDLENILKRAVSLAEKNEEHKSQQKIIDKLIEDAVMEMNKSHAVTMLNGKCVIINEQIDHEGKKQVSFSNVTDFYQYYKNKYIVIGFDKKYKEIKIPIAPEWMAHPKRREYRGVIFEPRLETKDFYNLWQGFAVKPKPRDWTLFKNHIYEVICSKNDKIFKYVMAWMADIVQSPRQKPGVALVLRGGKGCGKSLFAELFGRIFGTHFLEVTNPNQVTGRFNSHFRDCILALVDEGVWAGSKEAEGTLKALITQEKIAVEQKGKDVFMLSNYSRFIFASNESWVVPASGDERRFLVLDVSDHRTRDYEYFRQMVHQMENGGFEAMLHELMHHDYSDVNLRQAPRSEALWEQILHSLPIEAKWWYEVLQSGTNGSGVSIVMPTKHEKDDSGNVVPVEWGWPDFVTSRYLWDKYKEFSDQITRKYHKLTPSQLIKNLKKFCNLVSARATFGGSRKYGYYIPPLEEARDQFAKYAKFDIEWEKEEYQPQQDGGIEI